MSNTHAKKRQKNGSLSNVYFIVCNGRTALNFLLGFSILSSGLSCEKRSETPLLISCLTIWSENKSTFLVNVFQWSGQLGLPEFHPISSSRFLLSTTERVITTRSNRMKFKLPARPARVSRCRFWVILFYDSLRWRTLRTLWYEHMVSVLRLFIFSWELSVRVYLILIQKVSRSCVLMLDKYLTVVHQSGGE